MTKAKNPATAPAVVAELEKQLETPGVFQAVTVKRAEQPKLEPVKPTKVDKRPDGITIITF